MLTAWFIACFNIILLFKNSVEKLKYQHVKRCESKRLLIDNSIFLIYLSISIYNMYDSPSASTSSMMLLSCFSETSCPNMDRIVPTMVASMYPLPAAKASNALFRTVTQCRHHCNHVMAWEHNNTKSIFICQLNYTYN